MKANERKMDNNTSILSFREAQAEDRGPIEHDAMEFKTLKSRAGELEQLEQQYRTTLEI